jgi:hypothetical protein
MLKIAALLSLLICVLGCAIQNPIKLLGCSESLQKELPVPIEWFQGQLSIKDLDNPKLYNVSPYEMVKEKVELLKANLKAGDTIWYYKAPANYVPKPVIHYTSGVVVIRGCRVIDHFVMGLTVVSGQ